METPSTKENQLLNEIKIYFPVVHEKIVEGLNEYKGYCDVFKKLEFRVGQDEKEEDAIERAENMHKGLGDMVNKNNSLKQKASEVIESLNKMTELFKEIVENTAVEKREMEITNNELIDEIIDLEDRKYKKLIEKIQRKKNELKGEFEDKKVEWNEKRIESVTTLPKEKLEILDDDEMKQIKSWTGLTVENILFDSNIDNWKEKTSVFDRIILNKSNLIFIIVDNDGNKFGGYTCARIDKTRSFINDSKSFVFSLKSNGRLNKSYRFKIGDPQEAFYMGKQSDNDWLFSFGHGGDICIYKENNKHLSFCKQTSFNYNGVITAFCGKEGMFVPTRIGVVQLI